MNKCGTCQSEIQPQHRFCSNCGTVTDTQQQEASTSPIVLASANQPDGQHGSSHAPTVGIGQISHPDPYQAPGAGMSYVMYPSTP